ncbi:LysE family translocator [Nocardiopsis gilva]|nr:LysE family translocator [Nocardiopsis gilva]
MPDHLVVFISVTLLMLIVPGPDFVIVTRNALSGGRIQGYLTTLGICCGLAFLSLLAASGVAAVINANATLLTLLRILGALYLIFLGATLAIGSILRSGRGTKSHSRKAHSRTPVLQGFLNNVLNPKALVFYLTLMPQFVVAEGSVLVQTLILGALVVMCAAGWWGVYVTAISRMSALLAHEKTRTGIDIIAGVALVALGIWMALARSLA